LEGGRGGRLISPAGPREGGRGGGTTSLKGGYGPPGWQKNPTLRTPVASVLQYASICAQQQLAKDRLHTTHASHDGGF
jgi:hypothetical protein